MAKRILVIEDDEAVRAVLWKSLKGFGYDVAEASTGAKGLAALEEREFDLVILDYALPMMSGAVVAKTIHERNPNQRILLVSGYVGTQMLESSFSDMPMLAKPFRVEDLLAAVEKTIAE